jgi:hypothetical protein
MLSGLLQKDTAVHQLTAAHRVPKGTPPGALDVVTAVVWH